MAVYGSWEREKTEQQPDVAEQQQGDQSKDSHSEHASLPTSAPSGPAAPSHVVLNDDELQDELDLPYDEDDDAGRPPWSSNSPILFITLMEHM